MEQEGTRDNKDKGESVSKKELLNEYRNLITYSFEGRNYFSNTHHTDRLEYELLKHCIERPYFIF